MRPVRCLARVHWLCLCLPLSLLVGCEPLYQSYSYLEPRQTTLPVTLAAEEVWIASIPPGADVYIQPFDPEQLPSHSTLPDEHKGTTPLRLTLPPGRYWIEVALTAEVFANYFSPPYEDAQFEQDGAASEALLFRPFDPSEKRRVLRYYRLEKEPGQGQTVIALFHPRGEPFERVAVLYPREEAFQFVPQSLPALLQAAEIPEEKRAPLLTLLRRGGKVVWAQGDDYQVALELMPKGIQGNVIALFTGVPLPDPFIPDGGGF